MRKACVVFSSLYFAGLEIYTPTVFRVAAAFFFILCPLAWISCLRDPELINFRGFYSLFKCSKMHIASILHMCKCLQVRMLGFQHALSPNWVLNLQAGNLVPRWVWEKLAKSLPEIWQSPGLPSFVYSRYPCPSPFSNQGIRNTCRRCGTGRDGVLKKWMPKAVPIIIPL